MHSALYINDSSFCRFIQRNNEELLFSMLSLVHVGPKKEQMTGVS